MFPDKPNLRSRKAFFVVKKKAYMVCSSIDLFPEKNIGFRVSKNRNRKRFLLTRIITMNKNAITAGRYADLFLHSCNP